MWSPYLEARKLYSTDSRGPAQVTALVFVGKAQCNYFFIRLHVSDLIAFTTPQLQPCLTVSFILAYAQHVLVEKFNVLSFMQNTCPPQQASVGTPI